MSKMTDIIDRRIDQKLQAQQQEKHVPCIIESVSDDHLRADVSLLTDRNTIIKSRLNKSGEKLTAGQQAWLYYTTLPSSGYIGRTEGEADPMGGGGASTTVENAAILTDDTFSDYAVDNELIVNLEPDGHIYYGLDTGQVGMCIVQGRYCVWGGIGSWTPTYTDGAWKIFGSEELYETLINNIDKFSSQWGNYDPEHPELGGGWLFQPTTVTVTTTYPPNTKQVMVEIYGASKSGSGVAYNVRLKLRHFVNDPPVGDKWWEETITHSRLTSQYSEVTMAPSIKSGDGTTVFKNRLTDLVIVPVIRSYSSELTYGSGGTKVDTPYGYAEIGGFLLLAQDGSNGWGATITGGTTYWYQDRLGCVPLISEAEKAFLLGITKKTEPIPGA